VTARDPPSSRHSIKPNCSPCEKECHTDAAHNDADEETGLVFDIVGRGLVRTQSKGTRLWPEDLKANEREDDKQEGAGRKEPLP
jgi:hypothetical protein